MSGASNTFSNIGYSSLTLTGSVVTADLASGFLLPASKGGTGVANNVASTLTISGSFGTTLTVTGATALTLPTTGTLATLAGAETLTNKTLTSPVIGTITNTGTLTLPTSTDTLVGRATTDTLSNKTLTSPVIGTIVNTGTLTLPTSTDTLVGRATTDTLTNKTLTAPLQSSYEDFTEIATPGNPSSGKLRLFAQLGETLATVSSAGTVTPVGSGSGQKNYVQTSSNTSAGWLSTNAGTTAASVATISTDTTAADLPRANTTKSGANILPVVVSSSNKAGTFTATLSATPTVLTFSATGIQSGYVIYLAATTTMPGGLLANTPYWVTMVTSTTGKLSDTYAHYLAGTFVASNSTAGVGTLSYGWQGAVIPWTLDAADYGVKLGAQWAQNILSGATGDWQVDVYYNTSSSYTFNTYTRVPLSTDTSSQTLLPNAELTQPLAFDAPGSAAPYMEIRFQNVAATTHALVVSDLIVGPGVKNIAPAVGVVNPTVTWNNATGPTITNNLTFYRNGEELVIDGNTTFTLADGSTGSALTLSFTGLTLVANTGGAVRVEKKTTLLALTYDALATGGVIGFNTSNTGSASVAVLGTDIGGVTSGKINAIYFQGARFKVNEWAGSGTVNLAQNDVEYAYTTGTWDADDSTTGYGQVGASISSALTTRRTKTVTWQRPIQKGDVVEVLLDLGGVGNWVPAVGARGADGSFAVLPYTYLTGTATAVNTVGVAYSNISSTQTAIQFGTNLSCDMAGTNATAWNAAGVVSSPRWLVRKISGGAAVGFGAYVPGTSAGLVPAAGLPGNTTGTSGSGSPIAAGTVGELKESNTNQSITGGAATTAGNALVTLTAGIWLVWGAVETNSAAGVTTTTCQWVFETVAGTTFAKDEMQSDSGSADRVGVAMSNRVFTVASGDADKTLTLKITVSSTQTVYSYIGALRVA